MGRTLDPVQFLRGARVLVGQKLIVFTAEPGSESEKALQFLLQWSDAAVSDRKPA